jgi:hypothetical protein
MLVLRSIAPAAILCAALAPLARADHHGMVMAAPDAAPVIDAGVAVVAGSFAATIYQGSYQGLLPSVAVATGRLTLGAQVGLYRLAENGATQRGLGDVVGHAGYALLAGPAARAGLSLAASLPTGDPIVGLGMGHAMVMPAGWASCGAGPVTLTGSLGYGRALVASGVGHDHGPWPVVDAMNMAEVTWAAGAELPLLAGLRAGARLSGGIPVGLPGTRRVVGGARLSWSSRRLDTGVTVEAGLAGDPLTFRGVLDTALHF